MELEAPLTDDLALQLRDLASLWADLLYVMMVLSERGRIPNDPKNLFVRRAFWEGAVVGYGRCFNTGRRNAEVRPLLARLDPALRERHDRTLEWRNHHVAHRVSSQWERAAVTGVLASNGTDLAGIRVRVATRIGPEEDEEAAELERLTITLKDLIWEDYLQPLEAQLLTLYRNSVSELSATAAPFELGEQSSAELLITINTAGWLD